MNNFNDLADQVLAIDSSKNKSDIIIDLKYTKSVEATINRIFDGQFLNGTERDPSLKEAFLILDSDEEDTTNTILSPVPTPAPILLQDSSEADVLASPIQSRAERRKKSVDFLFDLDDPLFSISSKERQTTQSNDKNHDSTPQEDDDIVSLPSFHDFDMTAEPKQDFLDDTIGKSPDFFLDEDDGIGKSPGVTYSLDGGDDDELKQHDSDSDSIVSIPSMNDFLDELISDKRPTPVFEIEDDDDKPTIVDKKGKGKARETDAPPSWDDGDTPLTAKERKKLEVEERKRKRAEEAEEKKRAKVKLAEEKKRQKEQKEFEKMRNALFEKENRIRTDRTDILKEMIIDVHPEFIKTRSGQLMEALLLRKNTEICNLLKQQAEPRHTISWRRKCNSEWNDDSQTFIPLSTTQITHEHVVLVHVYTHEFVDHIQNDAVDQYIDRIEQTNPGCQIMLMLEGLDAYYKKRKLSQRRQFDAQVRNSIESSQPRKRKNDVVDDAPEQAEVEESLNYLQLIRHVMLVPTKDEEDTASWIESLTIDLGLSRYKTKNLNNNYKVSKSGTDPQDLYFKMLQEVQLCTPAVAKSIIYTYPTVQSLHRAYDNALEGDLLLANLDVERSAIHMRDRKINRAMSKKIHAIFTSEDPDKTIY